VAVATPLEVMTSSAMATDCSDGGEAATEAVPMEAGVGGSHSPNIGDVITAPVSGQVVKSVEEVVSKQLQLMMDRLPPEERTKWLLEAAQVRYTQIPWMNLTFGTAVVEYLFSYPGRRRDVTYLRECFTAECGDECQNTNGWNPEAPL
jgi:hypothetical protein